VLRCVPRTPTARSGKKKVMSYDLREVGNYARNRSILWPLKLGYINIKTLYNCMYFKTNRY
jgi:hypothetical protein